MADYTLTGLLADLGPSRYEDQGYDRIDELLDDDPIELGRRYRAALGLLKDPVGTAIEAGALEEDGVWADPDDPARIYFEDQKRPGNAYPLYRRVEPTRINEGTKP